MTYKEAKEISKYKSIEGNVVTMSLAEAKEERQERWISCGKPNTWKELDYCYQPTCEATPDSWPLPTKFEGVPVIIV